MNLILFFTLSLNIFNINPILAAKDCLKCNKYAVRAERELFDFFAREFFEMYDMYAKARDTYRNMYAEIMKPYEDKYLDSAEIKELGDMFKSRLMAIENSEATGIDLIAVIMVEMKTVKFRVESAFNNYELYKCGNIRNDVNCGFLEEKVIKCSTCEEETMLCVGGKSKTCSDLMQNCPLCVCQDEKCYKKNNIKKKCKPCPEYNECLPQILPCATREVTVEEDRDFYFDCFVMFHTRIVEQVEYVLEKKHDRQTIHVKTVDTAKLVKYMASMEDAGEYTCTVRSKVSKFAYGSVDIIVIVTPAPITPPSLTTVPTNQTSPEDFTIIIAVVILIVMIILVTLVAAGIGYLLRHRTEQELPFHLEQHKQRLEKLLRWTKGNTEPAFEPP